MQFRYRWRSALIKEDSSTDERLIIESYEGRRKAIIYCSSSSRLSAVSSQYRTLVYQSDVPRLRPSKCLGECDRRSDVQPIRKWSIVVSDLRPPILSADMQIEAGSSRESRHEAEHKNSRSIGAIIISWRLLIESDQSSSSSHRDGTEINTLDQAAYCRRTSHAVSIGRQLSLNSHYK